MKKKTAYIIEKDDGRISLIVGNLEIEFVESPLSFGPLTSIGTGEEKKETGINFWNRPMVIERDDGTLDISEGSLLTKTRLTQNRVENLIQKL